MSRREAGFTVVETLIVLAIAGLILLIVFEALPALQRSSRNNQRRQDVQLILGAVSHYGLNNSGNFPLDCDSSHPCTSAAGGGAPNDYFLHDVASKLSFYTNTNQVTLQSVSAGQGAPTNPDTDADAIYIYNHQKCDPTSPGKSTYQGAGYRDVVVLFAIETTSGSAPECQQL